MKRGYSIVDTTSLPSANSLDHHAQLLNMSAMIKQFSEQMEFLKSNIEIQQHHPSGRGVELVQERTDIALQNALKSTAEPLPIQGPDGTIQWQNELYLPNSSSSVVYSPATMGKRNGRKFPQRTNWIPKQDKFGKFEPYYRIE